MTITKIAPGYCEHCEKGRPLWIIAGVRLCQGVHLVRPRDGAGRG